ncbi:MAG: Na(+)/H(+) antiporter subunit C [Synergistaceae bacterium]|nr:Na(+)/H(+) antiporter subunit C [Synergistaceae bacterium]
MEALMAVVTGFIFAAGTYMLLSRSLLRILFGTSLLTHGALLLLITMGKLKRGEAPVLRESAIAYADPLPQAMILTAIVIGFALTALIIVFSFRAYQTLGTDDTEDLKGME